jgi:hypothetical protein
VELLLNMLGEQKACALVYATACATSVTLCVVLIPRFGLTGAALPPRLRGWSSRSCCSWPPSSGSASMC